MFLILADRLLCLAVVQKLLCLTNGASVHSVTYSWKTINNSFDPDSAQAGPHNPGAPGVVGEEVWSGQETAVQRDAVTSGAQPILRGTAGKFLCS
jgi:hypothetical protein